MTEHHVLVQMKIVTESPLHCSQMCPHYISTEYECRLFRPGDILHSTGTGSGFRLRRHEECLRATEGE
jgi:hypothetical protein